MGCSFVMERSAVACPATAADKSARAKDFDIVFLHVPIRSQVVHITKCNDFVKESLKQADQMF
jgi:hypothetical protein